MKTEPDLLIIKFLQGTITDVEKEVLMNWSQRSEANKKIFDESVGVWQLTKENPAELDFSSREEWEKISVKLNISEANSNPIPISNYWWLTGIAASLLIVVISYFTILKKEEQYQKLYTAIDKVVEAELPDGSTVWLNEKSKIAIEENFIGNVREVTLEGEAYFDVKKMDQKPFLVHTGNVTVKVVGTSFHIKTGEVKNTKEIHVVSGKVAFFSHKSPHKGVTLEAGMKGVYLSSSDSIYTVTYNEDNSLAWQTRKLIFSNSTVRGVVAQLQNHYKVDIQVKEPSILNCKFTGTFENASINDILNVLAVSLNLQYLQEGDKFLIKGKGCS